MNTNSIVYLIRDSDLYEIMQKDISQFDMSDYPNDKRFQLIRTEKLVELMKDEWNGWIMLVFAGLRAQMRKFCRENFSGEILLGNRTDERY